MSKLFLRGQINDISTEVRIEDLGGNKRRLHIVKSQDVEPLIQQNAEMRNDNTLDRHRGHDEWIDKEPFAEIPMTVIWEWIQKFNFNILASPAQNGMTREQFQKKQRALLNSPDYSYLKTYSGRV